MSRLHQIIALTPYEPNLHFLTEKGVFAILRFFAMVSFLGADVLRNFANIPLERQAGRVARFFLVKHTKTGKNVSINHKIFQTATK
jgi:hypothetical protein